MRSFHKIGLVVASLTFGVFLCSCEEKSNPTGAGTKAPKVNLNAKTILEGVWDGPDPDPVPYYWSYVMTGDSIAARKVQGNDTAFFYGGIFTLDSMVSPHRMDITITSAQYNGQKVLALYDYLGVQGSYIQLSITKNLPGTPRPTGLSEAIAILFDKQGGIGDQ